MEVKERDRELLQYLDEKIWARPMDVGGFNGSYHSGVLAQLARQGLAERKKSCWCSSDPKSPAYNRKHPWCRCKGSCRYRRTAKGTRLLRDLRKGRAK